MRLAFLFIAEAYQLYHAAATMFELIGRPDVEADIFYIDPAIPEHLERLRTAHGAPPVKAHYLPAGPLGSLIQSARILGLAKPQVLDANAHRFHSYDALLSTEDGIVRLFSDREQQERPARIIISHGVGGRHVPSFVDLAKADLVVAKGPGDAENLIGRGLVRPDQVIAGGDQKLATSRLLAQQSEPLFPNQNPIVLYNPHKERRQRSWDRFFRPLLEGFRADRSRNLIVAPHIKMFRRRSERRRNKLRNLSDDTILVDPGSFASLDNSYTEAANIYVGDVSSQVAEFLARPRPCVFLNAHGIDWRTDPHYAMWHMGEVVDDPDELMAAIDRAPQRHPEFRERQAEFASRSLGDISPKSAVASADAILRFLYHRQRQ